MNKVVVSTNLLSVFEKGQPLPYCRSSRRSGSEFHECSPGDGLGFDFGEGISLPNTIEGLTPNGSGASVGLGITGAAISP